MAATANLRLFVNWYLRSLQISDTNSGIYVLPFIRKYETLPLEIVIVEPDGTQFNRFSRVDISNLSISVAINDTYDDASPLCYQNTFTKDETNNIFKGELALNTGAFNTYLGSADSKSAYFEIEMQEGTARSKIYTQLINVYNAVTQTAVTVPSPLDEYLTKAQQSAQFAQKIMPAGEQFTITSPGGLYTRTFGVDDGGAPIDIILPV